MAYTPTYHKRNLATINTLAPNTKRAATQWYNWCVEQGYDILIYEGIRTLATQKSYVARGASRTLRSWHLVGQALDFVPIVNGKAAWNGYGSAAVKAMIKKAKQLSFEWGGDWTSFVDSPHLQYNYKGYGTDKELVSPVTPEKYRIETGTWPTLERAEMAKSIVVKRFGWTVYVKEEGSKWKIVTGTMSREDAQTYGKLLTKDYKWLTFPVEA